MFGLFKRRKTPEPQSEVVLPTPRKPARVTVPRSIVFQTFTVFQPYREARVETALFWAGPDTDGPAVVTTVVQPRLIQTPGNYEVPREARRLMCDALMDQGLVIHAQVHTHPRASVGHSSHDDKHAYSTAEGSLSLVWPHYGSGLHWDLRDVGFHVRQQGRWVQLRNPEEQHKHMQVVDSQIDLRWAINKGELDDE